jgi:hypothetical protein
MGRSHCAVRLPRVATGLSILLVLLLTTMATAQMGPASFKDALRGDQAKAWMTKEVTPKKKYLIGVALPNMPDPTWQTVWYGILIQAQKLGVDARLRMPGLRQAQFKFPSSETIQRSRSTGSWWARYRGWRCPGSPTRCRCRIKSSMSASTRTAARPSVE